MNKNMRIVMRMAQEHYQWRLERGLLSEEKKEWMRGIAKKHPRCFTQWEPYLGED